MELVDPKRLSEEAQAEYKKKKYTSAAMLYQAAADGCLSAGDELAHAEMRNNASVAFLMAGDGQEALELAMGTDMIFAANKDIRRQAMAIGNQAAALEKLKRTDEALAAYEKSAQLLGEAGEADLRASVFQSISTLKLRKRDYLEAYGSMRAGVIGIKEPTFKQKLVKTLMDLPLKLLK